MVDCRRVRIHYLFRIPLLTLVAEIIPEHCLLQWSKVNVIHECSEVMESTLFSVDC